MQVHRMRLAARQRDAAETGGDGAAVRHLRRDQRGEAGLADRDAARVLDACIGSAGAVEHHPAGEEVLVGDVGAGGDEARRLDLRALAEHDARLVDDGDPPVRRDSPGDDGGVRPRYAVQRDRAAGGLLELHLVAAAHVEAAPVHDPALLRLVHLGAGRILLDGDAARDHAVELRPRIGRDGLRPRRERRDQCGAAEQCGAEQAEAELDLHHRSPRRVTGGTARARTARHASAPRPAHRRGGAPAGARPRAGTRRSRSG